MSDKRMVATGARKREWEMILLDPSNALIAQYLELAECTCCDCGEAMLMDRPSFAAAEANHWPKVCLACVCHAKGIPYPDTNLPRPS